MVEERTALLLKAAETTVAQEGLTNTTQVVLEHIQVHNNFPHALKTQLNWSKDVQDKTRCAMADCVESA